jgi:uncharacterized protein YdaU (DUF1376 family)
MNYYNFHIGDYVRDTRHLSWDEDMAYRRLLDVYYSTEKPLPSDMRAVYRLVMATTDTQRQAVQAVLEEFFDDTPSGWVNGRADIEIEVMKAKQQKQREKANKRWHMPRTEHGIAPALPQQSSEHATASNAHADAMPPTPTPTPTPIINKAPRKRAAQCPQDVREEVWESFIHLRKAKRAPVTDIVIDGIRREAGDAGYSMEEALTTCIERGWQSFRSDWVAGKPATSSGLFAGAI